MALTIAFTKIGMNVSLSPSRFSKIALFLALHFTTLVTSVSMNEVTCGEVRLEFTMASAIILRTLSICMISSPSPTFIGAAGVAATGVGIGVGVDGCGVALSVLLPAIN